ncbi:hypothetical protein MHC_04910 [Mycoplasma haemocanis str. Illinois]|uniref:Uncharacterized protein n=1 Tax=Mycoplasma haemocanis (strain Illinois) TaxID=1111676 RepID=H6N866_MYCHN|nr:hypothetical protein [Mycoplasma haemocanis]AEW45838.1 hypothetical protein MHC_04910 [Mycoplasma haemocanis str. Illinois]
MNYLAKGFVGVAGCSSVCGGYFVFKHFNPDEDFRPTVRSLIVSSGRTLLTKESSQWLERWKEYVDSHENTMEIEGYEEKAKNKDLVPDEFKSKCLLGVDKKVFGAEDKLFKDLSTWCVEMTTISSLISSHGKRQILNTSTGDTEEWKASWKNYVDNSHDNSWGIDKWETVKSNLETVPDDFKSKCTSKISEKAFGVKDVKFENVISWCTKNK